MYHLFGRLLFPEFLTRGFICNTDWGSSQLPGVALTYYLSSPGYIPVLIPEEVRRRMTWKDPVEDPTDYPADRGDDGDDEEPSDNDDDDDDDDAEEEEHLAPADPAVVAYSADQDPYLALFIAVTARMVHPNPMLRHVPLEEVAESLYLPYLLTTITSLPILATLPQIPLLSTYTITHLPISHSPTYVEGSLGSRAAGIRKGDALPYPVHETEMLC
ncbi:hypothetical protein Tco_0879399 [Tanacetum coccineum]